MRKRHVFAGFILAAAFFFATAEEACARTTGGGEIMTNDKVISLVKAGVSEDIILRMVQGASRAQFDLTVKGVLALKSAGVSERIISAMMDIYKKEEQQRDRDVRIYIQMLRSDISEEYDRAVRELTRFGAYGVPLLIENLTNDDERIRAGCAEVLGRIADPASLEHLFQALLDRNQAVRAKAARAISMFPKEEVGPRLASGMDRKGVPRDGFALALGYIGDMKYLRPLVELASDPGPEVDRAAAAYALGLLGDPKPEVMTALIELVQNETSRDLREAAARALGRLAARMTYPAREAATRALIKSLQRHAPGRDVLALQLRFFPSRRTVEALLDYVGDRDKNVASSAWEALRVVTGEELPQDAEQWKAWWELAKNQPRWRETAETESPLDTLEK